MKTGARCRNLHVSWFFFRFSYELRKKIPDIPGGGGFGTQIECSKEESKKEVIADFKWLVHEVELEEMNKRWNGSQLNQGRTQGLELPSLSESHQSPEKTIHNPKPPLLPLDNNEHHYCIYLSITSVLHFLKLNMKSVWVNTGTVEWHRLTLKILLNTHSL